MATFPSLGDWGAEYEIGLPEGGIFRRRYADNSKREYRLGSATRRVLTLGWQNRPKADYELIRDFVLARLADGATFVIYNPLETFVLDLSGVVTTGRHTCDEIIGDTTGPWRQESDCRYGGTISFYLIN